jgi:hypothetical protein
MRIQITNKGEKGKKKAVDATISDDGQTRQIHIKYDDGSTEKFVDTDEGLVRVEKNNI